ncbi:MAG: hypothetical protein KZQ70_09960 [gamma proteobacterium symbiont of Lucinoma myriamae]|nr:hypothetical protein [gamma proteobacterium symbiont of Lucinoma myriamae]
MNTENEKNMECSCCGDEYPQDELIYCFCADCYYKNNDCLESLLDAAHYLKNK